MVSVPVGVVGQLAPTSRMLSSLVPLIRIVPPVGPVPSPFRARMSASENLMTCEPVAEMSITSNCVKTSSRVTVRSSRLKPVPIDKVSTPAPPTTVASLASKTTTSLPAPALMTSAPPAPSIKLSPALPVIWSDAPEAITFSMPSNVSLPAFDPVLPTDVPAARSMVRGPLTSSYKAVSIPSPPTKASLPAPPLKLSLPRPPFRVSSPALPNS